MLENRSMKGYKSETYMTLLVLPQLTINSLSAEKNLFDPKRATKDIT